MNSPQKRKAKSLTKSMLLQGEEARVRGSDRLLPRLEFDGILSDTGAEFQLSAHHD
jgi:hypothetical protein